MLLSLFALVGLVAALLAWAAPSLPREPRLIVCDANSETPINEPDEYPAWELRCDGDPDVRVVVVD